MSDIEVLKCLKSYVKYFYYSKDKIKLNELKGKDCVHNGNEMYFVLVKPAVHVVCRTAARMRWPSLRQG